MESANRCGNNYDKNVKLFVSLGIEKSIEKVYKIYITTLTAVFVIASKRVLRHLEVLQTSPQPSNQLVVTGKYWFGPGTQNRAQNKQNNK